MFSTGWAIALTIALQATPAPAATPALPWPNDRPITHFFQNLGHDLVALPSTRTAKILVVGGGATALSHQWDDRLSAWVTAQGPPAHTAAGRVIGGNPVQWGAAFGLYAAGRIAHAPTISHIGSDLIRVQALAAVVTQGLKFATDRTRPSGASWSFPSGHTSASFATATVLQSHFGWRAGVPAYVLASYVGWSRIRDNVHWLSDVVFGATVGIIAGETVAAHHHRLTVVPVGTPGGAAVYVLWSPSTPAPRRR